MAAAPQRWCLRGVEELMRELCPETPTLPGETDAHSRAKGPCEESSRCMGVSFIRNKHISQFHPAGRIKIVIHVFIIVSLIFSPQAFTCYKILVAAMEYLASGTFVVLSGQQNLVGELAKSLPHPRVRRW